MVVMVDKRIKRFVRLFSHGGTNDPVTVYLADVDESFHFATVAEAQEFLHTQARERVGDKELRKGYFDYVDEYGETHRYQVLDVKNGMILSFQEEMVA